MTVSLEPVSAEDSPAFDRFTALADEALRHDGHDPFNEQTRLDVRSGARQGLALVANATVVGAAVTGGGELDLVIHPAHRRRGHALDAMDQLLPTLGDEVTAWSHGDHPGARALAAATGFDAVRTLLRLRLAPLPAGSWPQASFEITRFTVGDIDDWVALNSRVFASHPEQGRVTADDVRARMAEPWFDANDFLLARQAGELVGYNWLKREPGSTEGEIYVIGVDERHAGEGIGRTLMQAGLARLAEAGSEAVTLYVEADNEPALHLYRRFGFVDDLVDVQYRRRAASVSTRNR